MALYRSPLTVTLWPASFLKKYGPMIPPAHKAHQTVSFSGFKNQRTKHALRKTSITWNTNKFQENNGGGRWLTPADTHVCVPFFSASVTRSAVLTSFLELYYGDRFNSCQVVYSQFGLAIHQNDHQARRRFVGWAQNEIAVVPDFHKRILFSDEAHFWLNGYVNKQNCRIWSEANPQVYVETPLHPEKLTVWRALWAGGILLQKR
ncbi:DUF4817 domain-containing protein [Trichonephila clavipes]|nr:DUF4817 domain-containing protein [Trichonephila clavipes]